MRVTELLWYFCAAGVVISWNQILSLAKAGLPDSFGGFGPFRSVRFTKARYISPTPATDPRKPTALGKT